MDYIIPIIVALLGSGMWTALFDYLKNRQNKMTVEKQMLLGLGHDRLYDLMTKYIEKGYVTVDELENIGYIYKPYCSMGGNGTCERLYEEIVCKLPHKKDNGNE